MSYSHALTGSFQDVHKYGDVSRETAERLKIYVDLVLKWQPAQNLIAPSTIPDIWERHVIDSLATKWMFPEARVWADIGSGAGFPGIVTAILQADDLDAHVHFIESNQRKVAFLRTVLRETGSRGTVYPGRIEKVAETLNDKGVEAVSARALANLDQLLAWSEPFWRSGATCVFHKGQDFQREVNEASQRWTFDLVQRKSLIDPSSRLLLLSKISSRQT